MNWIPLSSVKELEDLLQASKTYLIFKHSTRCPVSFAAKKRFEMEWAADDLPIDAYYLDLIEHRAVSNLIEDKLGVKHQSPQLILVKSGEVLHHTSHTSISLKKVKEHI